MLQKTFYQMIFGYIIQFKMLGLPLGLVLQYKLLPEFCTHLAFNGQYDQFFQNEEEQVFYPFRYSFPFMRSG
jgi:hypothetical protein